MTIRDSTRLDNLRDALRDATTRADSFELELRAAPEFWSWLAALKGPMGCRWAQSYDTDAGAAVYLMCWSIRPVVDPAAAEPVAGPVRPGVAYLAPPGFLPGTPSSSGSADPGASQNPC